MAEEEVVAPAELPKNRDALALAYKRAIFNRNKVKEFGITPDMSSEDKVKLAKALAEKKAEKLGVGTWKDYVEGQEKWIDSLKNFAQYETPEDAIAHEYDKAFADVASEKELMTAIKEKW